MPAATGSATVTVRLGTARCFRLAQLTAGESAAQVRVESRKEQASNQHARFRMAASLSEAAGYDKLLRC